MTKPITLTTQIRANPDVVDQILDGEAILVLAAQQKIKVLNEVGAYIWTQIKEKISVSEIINRIVETYRVSPQDAEKDVCAFLTDLAERELIQIEPI